MFSIYIITNTINDKKYIGQTIKSLDVRFQRHCWASEYKKNMPIGLAIKKYGKENFAIKLLEKVKTLEEANRQEIYWAKIYNTLSPMGYNLKVGGRKYSEVSQETRDKIRKSNLGKKATPETRKRLSDSHKGQVMSQERREHLSRLFKGRVPHKNTATGASLKNSKKYLFLNPEGDQIKIENLRKFCFENNINYNRLSGLTRRANTQYKGWRFVRYL